MLPPAFSIFSFAVFECGIPVISSFFSSFPFARIFGNSVLLISFLSIRTVMSIFAPASNEVFSASRLIGVNVILFGLLNPRSFDMWARIPDCPPSNPRRTPPPALAFCPLHPLPENVPRPLPSPRPTRFLDFDFSGESSWIFMKINLSV